MKKPTEIFTNSFVRSIAQLVGVTYHHHDVFDAPRYTDNQELAGAIVVVYDSQYGQWQFAINYDGTISMPHDDLAPRKMAEDIVKGQLTTPLNRTIGYIVAKPIKESGWVYLAGRTRWAEVPTLSGISLTAEGAFNQIDILPDEDIAGCIVVPVILTVNLGSPLASPAQATLPV